MNQNVAIVEFLLDHIIKRAKKLSNIFGLGI